MIKRALILSVVFHALLLAVLTLGFGFKMKPKEVTISARLVIKSQKKNKDLLPKKAKAEKLAKEPEKKLASNSQDLAKLKQEPPKIAPESAKPKQELPKVAEPQKVASKQENYADTLKALSQSFAQEINKGKAESQPEDEGGDDYFDQIYSLLKSSFVIPPHLNGPKGEKLAVVVRLFLAKDGRINKLDLETSSGDDHFDKAVMDGAKRVNSFGPVPIVLQDTLREKGLVVELCPFKCLNSR